MEEKLREYQKLLKKASTVSEISTYSLLVDMYKQAIKKRKRGRKNDY